jgi:hypothetical protein
MNSETLGHMTGRFVEIYPQLSQLFADRSPGTSLLRVHISLLDELLKATFGKSFPDPLEKAKGLIVVRETLNVHAGGVNRRSMNYDITMLIDRQHGDHVVSDADLLVHSGSVDECA